MSQIFIYTQEEVWGHYEGGSITLYTYGILLREIWAMNGDPIWF